jgi:anti-sigma-K factor RskA
VDYGRPELAERLAAAYSAGTLRGPARRRFDALLPAHPALRDAVRAWNDRLMPLTVALAPVAPPARVWQRIETRLDGSAVAATGTAPPPRAALGSRLAFWRGLAGFASIAALSLAVLLASPGPVQPPIIVVLSSTPPAGGSAAPATASFVASISGDGRALVTRPIVNVGVQADRSLELWAIPPGGAPRSLGVISASGATVVRKRQALEGADTLAVTLEPPGGSPSGNPTGPVLYAGKLTL